MTEMTADEAECKAKCKNVKWEQENEVESGGERGVKQKSEIEKYEKLRRGWEGC
jgi:hypothetical protein